MSNKSIVQFDGNIVQITKGYGTVRIIHNANFIVVTTPDSFMENGAPFVMSVLHNDDTNIPFYTTIGCFCEMPDSSEYFFNRNYKKHLEDNYSDEAKKEIMALANKALKSGGFTE